MLRLLAPLALAATVFAPSLLPAQARVVRPSVSTTIPERLLTVARRGDGPALGLTTSSGGIRDTLGLLVSGVTTGSPAEKAGLEEGNRIIAINGVNLRLSPADAGEPDMAGVLGRRFQRELDKTKPGDEVELRVLDEGQTKTVRVKSVRADELRTDRMSIATRAVADGATLGASVGGYPSPRDTLGVFIVSVAEDGPLAKAGIFEGSRVASINGVDLRVPAADASDEFMTTSRVRRLTREIEKLAPGANAELRVYTNGQYRNVTVQAVKRSDLKQTRATSIFSPGGMGSVFIRGGPGELPELMIDGIRMDMHHLNEDLHRAREELMRVFERRDTVRRSLDRSGDDAGRAELEKRLERLRSSGGRSGFPTASSALMTGSVAAGGLGSGALFQPAVRTVAPLARSETWLDRDGILSVAGIRFSRVDAQLASYLGEGSQNGLLVLEVDPRWSGILPGDVLLTVDGRPVAASNGRSVSLDISLSTSREQPVQLIRSGKQVSGTIIRR